jgi:hypothetical protein
MPLISPIEFEVWTSNPPTLIYQTESYQEALACFNAQIVSCSIRLIENGNEFTIKTYTQ